MSIVRIGLGENEKFGDGYDAIFGKKDGSAPAKPAATKKPAPAKKKPAGKKKPTKKK